MLGDAVGIIPPTGTYKGKSEELLSESQRIPGPVASHNVSHDETPAEAKHNHPTETWVDALAHTREIKRWLD